MIPKLLASAAIVALLAAPSVAHAYCRTSTCTESASATIAVCDPVYPTDCGTPIAWPQPCTEFSVQEDGSKKLGITALQTQDLLVQAFATWHAAACAGGGTPLMTVSVGPMAACSKPEYNTSGSNANVVMFDDDSWPYEGTPNLLALTTVTYGIDDAEIYDADMEINSANVPFTVGNTDVGYDLLSVLTHETGHFQGMAHTHDPSATMWPSYVVGTTNLRTLSDDDIAGICNAYPPGPAPSSCDPTPRHGFSAVCGADQPVVLSSSSCALSAPSAPSPASSGLLSLGALATVFAIGKRRRRSR